MLTTYTRIIIWSPLNILLTHTKKNMDKLNINVKSLKKNYNNENKGTLIFLILYHNVIIYS